MTIKLTLNQIKSNKPCKEGWESLLKSLNKTKADYTRVKFSYIAKINSVSEALWCLKCIDVKQYKKEIGCLMADIAESLEYLYTNDNAVKNCIKGIRDFVDGKITLAELDKSRCPFFVARNAASASAIDTVAYAISVDAASASASAAYAVVIDAAYVAYAAIDAVVYAIASVDIDCERDKQIKFIKKHLG